jgi:hypothetical protein
VRARTLHQSALDALLQAGDDEPVIVVDLVKLREQERRRMEVGEYSTWSAYSEARTLTGGRRLVSLTPHPGGGILLGNSFEHAYDLIELTEYSSASAAYGSLTDPKCSSRRERASCPDTSVVIWAQRSAAFAGMPTFAETGGEVSAPTDSSDPIPDPGASCPFASEASATAAAWTALETEPTQHMYAFNMIRIPDMEAYRAYSAHFASLPEKYGMKFVDVLSCQSEAQHSVRIHEEIELAATHARAHTHTHASGQERQAQGMSLLDSILVQIY